MRVIIEINKISINALKFLYDSYVVYIKLSKRNLTHNTHQTSLITKVFTHHNCRAEEGPVHTLPGQKLST